MQSFASLRKKQREILMHTSREGDMKVEAETGVIWTQANTFSHQKLKEVRDGILLRVPRGNVAIPTSSL